MGNSTLCVATVAGGIASIIVLMSQRLTLGRTTDLTGLRRSTGSIIAAVGNTPCCTAGIARGIAGVSVNMLFAAFAYPFAFIALIITRSRIGMLFCTNIIVPYCLEKTFVTSAC